MNRRHALLYGTLAATLAASAGIALQPDDEPPAVADARPLERGARRAQAAAAAAPASATVRLPLRGWTVPDDGALAAWSPPKPPPAPAAPKPAAAAVSAAPAAPAFPYRWIGRLQPDGENPLALLDGPQRSIGAGAGEVLDGQWRIDHVGDDRIDVTWLPGAQRVAVNAR